MFNSYVSHYQRVGARIPLGSSFECSYGPTSTSEAMATARCIGPWSVLVLRTLLAASYVGGMDGRWWKGRWEPFGMENGDESFLEIDGMAFYVAIYFRFFSWGWNIFYPFGTYYRCWKRMKKTWWYKRHTKGIKSIRYDSMKGRHAFGGDGKTVHGIRPDQQSAG